MHDRSDLGIVLAGTLIVSVALLFFFPVPIGGFQASHGPVSTLKEHDRSLALQTLIFDFIKIVHGEASIRPEQEGSVHVSLYTNLQVTTADSTDILRC